MGVEVGEDIVEEVLEVEDHSMDHSSCEVEVDRHA